MSQQMRAVAQRRILDVKPEKVVAYLPYFADKQRRKIVNSFFTSTGEARASSAKLYVESENPMPPLRVLKERPSSSLVFLREVSGFSLRLWSARMFPTFMQLLPQRDRLDEPGVQAFFVRIHRTRTGVARLEDCEQVAAPALAEFVREGDACDFLDASINAITKVTVVATSSSLAFNALRNGRRTGFLIVKFA